MLLCVCVQPAPKTPSRSRQKSKSPSRGVEKEVVVTKRTITSSIFSSSSGQEKAAHTPVRSSSRIASLIEKEVSQTISVDMNVYLCVQTRWQNGQLLKKRNVFKS